MCWVHYSPSITVGQDDDVGNSKETIQGKRALDGLKDIGPHTLELWSPRTPTLSPPSHIMLLLTVPRAWETAPT
ncbi:hypothetical protein AX15_007857 [Amanita polypyramis BW_CC]|nr:hypothetical protein AX15_007857 [Amanita polypyramis BW_CC]